MIVIVMCTNTLCPREFWFVVIVSRTTYMRPKLATEYRTEKSIHIHMNDLQ